MKYDPSNVLVSVNGVEQKTNECEKIEINEPKVINITIKLKPEVRAINIYLQSTNG